MTNSNPHMPRCLLLAFCTVLVITVPVQAFTAESLAITVDKSGDATAVFRFTLEGLLENAIPQSMLEEQLVNGLSGSTGSPTLISMDRSSATLLMKEFASTKDVETGTEYLTSSMDFRKAEIALQNSAVSSVITADFSPSVATVTFPDGHTQTFNNVESLPSIVYTVVDPAKAQIAGQSVMSGAIKVSATPADAEVWIDGIHTGNAPSTFSNIAAGPHTLMFQKEGYVPVTKDITITGGKTLQVSVFLATAVPTTRASASQGGSMVMGMILAAGCIFLWPARRK